MSPTWKADLRQAVVKQLSKNKQSGITGIGTDNLFMILRFPQHGPEGTNARYIARQIFDEVVDELPGSLRRQILAIDEP